MGEDDVEVAAAFVDCGGKADNLGACADDYQQAQATVFFEFYVCVIGFH